MLHFSVRTAEPLVGLETNENGSTFFGLTNTRQMTQQEQQELLADAQTLAERKLLEKLPLWYKEIRIGGLWVTAISSDIRLLDPHYLCNAHLDCGAFPTHKSLKSILSGEKRGKTVQGQDEFSFDVETLQYYNNNMLGVEKSFTVPVGVTGGGLAKTYVFSRKEATTTVITNLHVGKVYDNVAGKCILPLTVNTQEPPELLKYEILRVDSNSAENVCDDLPLRTKTTTREPMSFLYHNFPGTMARELCKTAWAMYAKDMVDILK